MYEMQLINSANKKTYLIDIVISEQIVRILVDGDIERRFGDTIDLDLAQDHGVTAGVTSLDLVDLHAAVLGHEVEQIVSTRVDRIDGLAVVPEQRSDACGSGSKGHPQSERVLARLGRSDCGRLNGQDVTAANVHADGS